MTSEQKITYVEKQILACEQGRQNSINCPYCEGQNIEGNPLCCELFGRVVAAVLVRKDDQERAHKVEQILEKVQAN